MKQKLIVFIFACFFLLSVPLASADGGNSKDTKSSQERVVAIRSIDGKGIKENEIIQSKNGETLHIVDRDNNRYELGSGSSALFDSYSRFRLLRGSVILDSSDWGTVKTANSQFEYVGKAVISYDYTERSTSAFVIKGQARLRHETHTDRVQNMVSLEGASIVSGDFYPTWLKSLQFAEVSSWLKRYEWSEQRRRDLLASLKLKTHVNRKVASASAEESSEHDENRLSRENSATAELQEYFPGLPEQARDLVREKYTSSELRGKEHTAVERAVLDRDQIEFLRPEEAAAMILPKMEIRPQITAFPEKDRFKGRNLAALERVKQFDRDSEKPKVVKVYVKEKGPYDHIADPSVRSALSRLDTVAEEKSQTREDELRDRYFDQLRENF